MEAELAHAVGVVRDLLSIIYPSAELQVKEDGNRITIIAPVHFMKEERHFRQSLNYVLRRINKRVRGRIDFDIKAKNKWNPEPDADLNEWADDLKAMGRR